MDTYTFKKVGIIFKSNYESLLCFTAPIIILTTLTARSTVF